MGLEGGKVANETELMGKAIQNARDAYIQTFEGEGIEAAYYPILEITVGRSNSSFEELLEVITWRRNEYGWRKDRLK